MSVRYHTSLCAMVENREKLCNIRNESESERKRDLATTIIRNERDFSASIYCCELRPSFVLARLVSIE